MSRTRGGGGGGVGSRGRAEDHGCVVCTVLYMQYEICLAVSHPSRYYLPWFSSPPRSFNLARIVTNNRPPSPWNLAVSRTGRYMPLLPAQNQANRAKAPSLCRPCVSRCTVSPCYLRMTPLVLPLRALRIRLDRNRGPRLLPLAMPYCGLVSTSGIENSICSGKGKEGVGNLS